MGKTIRAWSRARALFLLSGEEDIVGHIAPGRGGMKVGRTTSTSGYFIWRRSIKRLSPGWGSPDSVGVSPKWGRLMKREDDMKLARRVAIALGSLLAVAIAGGAHWRV